MIFASVMAEVIPPPKLTVEAEVCDDKRVAGVSSKGSVRGGEGKVIRNWPEGQHLPFLMYAAGLWSLVVPNRPQVGEPTSPLANLSLLLLLVLTHLSGKGYNPYRLALSSFQDHREHGSKVDAAFCLNLEKLYLALCQYVTTVWWR